MLVRLWPAIPWIAIAFVLGVGASAEADKPAQSTAYEIVETPISSQQVVELDSNDDLWAGTGDVMAKSTDGGQSFTTYKTFALGSSFSSLWIDSNDNLYVGRSGVGKMWRGAVDGDSLTGSWVHTFACSGPCPSDSCAQLWQMAEDDSGHIYVAEYTPGTATPKDERCAYAYKSRDGGATFPFTIYDNPDTAKHLHIIAYDAKDDVVWISQGDGDEMNDVYYSTDYGASWSKPWNTANNTQPISWAWMPRGRGMVTGDEYQPDYIGTNSGTMLFGSDIGGGAANKVSRIAYSYIDLGDPIGEVWSARGHAEAEVEFTNGDANNGYVWVMGSTQPDTMAICGTVAISDANSAGLYLREASGAGDFDETGTAWTRLKIVAGASTGNAWDGVYDMTRFGADGYAYYVAQGDTTYTMRFTVQAKEVTDTSRPQSAGRTNDRRRRVR